MWRKEKDGQSFTERIREGGERDERGWEERGREGEREGGREGWREEW